MSIRKDNIGVKWAQIGDVRVSIPNSVPDADVQDYARLKIREQELMQQQLKDNAAVQAPPPKGPISFELPQNIRTAFDQIARLGRKADRAESDSLVKEINDRKLQLAQKTLSAIGDHLRSLDSDQLGQLRDKSFQEAEHLEAQAKAIKDLTESDIRSRGIQKEIADMRFAGGTVPREAEMGMGGQRGLMRPEDSTVGVEGRRTFDELQGRQPSRPDDAIEIHPAPEGVSAAEWDNHVAQVKERIADRKRRISDVVAEAYRKGTSLADQNIDEHVNALNEYESMLGTYKTSAEPGRRPDMPAHLNDKGAIEVPGLLKTWSLERARLALGKKLNNKPTDEEFFQHVDMRNEKARYFRKVAESAQHMLDRRATEGGFVGGSRLRGQVKQVSLVDRVPSDEEAVRRAKAAGFYATKIDDQFSSGTRGFLSKDGKTWIDTTNKNHSELAEAIMPDTPKGDMFHDAPLRALLEKGWIRKETLSDYETFHPTDPKATSVIEEDLLRHRMSNRPITIEYRAGDIWNHVDIQPGWEWGEFHDAVQQELRRAERGAAPATHLASASAGALVGAKVGGSIGGPVGAVAGGMAGFVVGFEAPAVFTSPYVKNAMTNMRTILGNAHMSMRDYFFGPPQIQVPGSPRMDAIMAEQGMHANRSNTWLERAKSLPPRIARGFDPFIYVADKQNMGFLNRAMMQFTKNGAAFRDLNVPDHQSLYLALREAMSSSYGQRANQMMQYKDILSDAKKAGLQDSLTRWLNWKGIDRSFKVLDEHMQDLQQKLQDTQNSLQNPNNTQRETVALQDRMKELQRLHNEMDNRIKNGQAAPQGYTPQTLQQDMTQFQQNLGHAKGMQLNDLANRVFKSREHILDMLHANGLISDEALQTYKARGMEYVPMERIVDDLADSKFHSTAQPLHLRHQTVIQTLEGSSRTQVSPWEAFAHADAKAFNQIIRNDTMRHALDLAQANPQTIGQEFKQVPEGYRAKKGEAILGHYEGGKPQLYAVPEYLGDTMNIFPAASKTAFGIMARMFAKGWKGTATVYNLGFQIASLAGHGGAGAIYSKVNSDDMVQFGKNWGRSVYSVLSKDQTYREMVRSGAAFGGFQMALDPEHFAGVDTLGLKKGFGGSRVLSTMEDWAANLENINRTNTFRNARLAGHNTEAAMREAKYRGGAPDFSRAMGDISQPLNQAFMFLNAHLQYATQMMDALRRDPKRVGGILATTAALGVALQSWNAQQKDSEGKPLMRHVPINERLKNWVILTPWTRTTKDGVEKAIQFNIPKPYPVQALSNPVEAAAIAVINKEDKTGSQQAMDRLRDLQAGDERTGTQQVLDQVGTMSPVPIRLQQGRIGSSIATGIVSDSHPLAKTFIQQYSNTDDFGHPIVPGWEQGLDPSLQYDQRTNPTAVAIGQGGPKGALVGGIVGSVAGGVIAGKEGAAIGGGIGITIGARGASPRRVEAGLRSMFASGATQTESYLSPFFGAHDATKQSVGDVIRSAPFLGPAATRFLGSDSDQEMNTASGKFEYAATQVAEPLKNLQRLIQLQPDKAEAYMQAHQADFVKAANIAASRRAIGDINKAIGQLSNSTDYSQKDKMEMLKQFRDMKLQIYRNVYDSVNPSPQVGQAAAFPGQGQGSPR